VINITEHVYNLLVMADVIMAIIAELLIVVMVGVWWIVIHGVDVKDNDEDWEFASMQTSCAKRQRYPCQFCLNGRCDLCPVWVDNPGGKSPDGKWWCVHAEQHPEQHQRWGTKG
jgi:hypothetical protein